MVFGACHKVPPVEPVSHRSDRWASEAERGFWPPGSIGRTGAAPVGPVGVGTEKWPSGPRRHRSNRCSTGQTGERRGQKRGRLDQGSVGPTGASPVGPVGVGARKGASGLKPHRSDRCLTGPTGGRRGPTVSKGSFTPLSPLTPSLLSFHLSLSPVPVLLSLLLSPLLSSPPPNHIHPLQILQGKGTKDSWWGTSPPRPPPSGSQVSHVEKRGKLLSSRYKSYPRPISF
jgi:hypothetical protein